ncbi:MAG: aldehyde ferredoxin oxidoreductase [Deltaproteobacteria bacterium]|nr:aldehyde ferredoxin oxidoreductase [Deltaproteobacteria bacterium]
MGKSPMTGLLGDSNMGGYFSPELKFAGYDHVLVTGRAEKPVYLWIENDRVEIRNASEIWGKDTYQTLSAIRRELGNPEVKVLSIGPAGENLVRFATIQSEWGNGAGRTGMGAVMGSKNLKAIAVRGTKSIKIANPTEYLAMCKEIDDLIRNSSAGQELSKYGTTMIMKRMMGRGRYQRNFQFWGQLENQITPLDIFKKYSPKKVGCYGCANRCMEYYEVPGLGSGVISCGIYVGTSIDIENNNPEVWWQSALSCQKQGIDADSVGKILAWAMELYQRGIITTEDTDGIPLEWGDKNAILTMIQKIAKRDGFGDVLADGMILGARRIGRGAEEYAMHCKGLPIAENSIGIRGMSLGIAVGPRGDQYRSYPTIEEGVHDVECSDAGEEYIEASKEQAFNEAERISGTRKGADPGSYEGKPAMIIHSERLVAITDSSGVCKWTTPWYGVQAYTLEHQAKLLSLGLGKAITLEMFQQIADRIRCLERAFDVDQGLDRSQETLPKRLFKMKPVARDAPLDPKKFEEMKSEYYSLRGWDIATGAPTKETLEQLGLGDVAKDLKKRDKLPA